MARVKERKASKDYPEIDVKKGETYYSWTPYKQAKRRSKTYPKRHELATGVMADFYRLVDIDLPDCQDDADLLELAANVRTCVEESQESYDNLPENFQNGEQGQKLENRVSEFESWADEIESAAEDLGSLDNWDNEEETWEEKRDAIIADLQGSAPDPE